MQDRYGYIYLTTNTTTGQRYVGQHRKAVFDQNYLGSGVRLKHSINKYGREYFFCSVLCWCRDEAQLNEKEILYIARIKPELNITRGGEGAAGFKRSPENCRKISEIQKGRKQRPETIAKRNAANTGKKRTAEARVRMSAAQQNRSEETRQKLREALTGKKLSAETRAKISLVQKGKIIPEETRRKMSAAHLGKKYKKRTAETQKPITEAMRGRRLTTEHKNNIALGVRRFYADKRQRCVVEGSHD